MPGFIGFPELLVLAVVVLLVFGPKRLPEMGRSIGHGMREFKSSISGDGKPEEHVTLTTVTTTESQAPAALPLRDRESAA